MIFYRKSAICLQKPNNVYLRDLGNKMFLNSDKFPDLTRRIIILGE